MGLPWNPLGVGIDIFCKHIFYSLIDKNVKSLFLEVIFCTQRIAALSKMSNSQTFLCILYFLQSLARSQADRSSHSAANAKKVFVLNASERIRKIEGNSYCADCSAPSKC